MAEALISTAVGEFSSSYLAKEAGKNIAQFIAKYGSTAFQRVAPLVTGGIIVEKVLEAAPPLDLQQEKLFGMPVSRITGQGEVYSDIEEPKEEEVLPTRITEEEPTTPTEPEPPKGPGVSDFLAETAIHAARKGTEELLKKKEEQKDITKQTKDLVTKEPEFGALTEVEKQTALLEKEGKPDFYSRAIKSIENAKPNKLTKTKWKSYIQSTKEELDYLGLTEFLKGNESITKKELLDFVKGKDIAATMVVRSVPKDRMNPMWKDYSLGGHNSGTQEHIVFQKSAVIDDELKQYDEEKKGTKKERVYTEPHFNYLDARGTFAHARVQVGYSPADAIVDKTGYNPNLEEDLEKKENINLSELFDNTLIIDEIQSDWIQKLQKEGSAKEWKIIKGSDITKEFLEKNYPGKYKIEKAPKPTSSIFRILAEAINQNGNPTGVWTEIQRAFTHRYYIFNKEGLYLGQNFKADSYEEAEAEIAKRAVPDLPLKDSKKFVELVLNEMIRKAVKDGRDSIAITNGQIQYNRYEAMGEKERQGLKKFYDTFVYDQLNKIAKNYGVKLERISIEDPEQAKMDQEDIQLRIPRSVKQALNQNFVLQKLSGEILNELVNNRDLPGHTSIYSNEGRGQGVDYIIEIIKLGEPYEDSYYIWTKENISEDINNLDVRRDFKNVVWDMPIVPVDDAPTNPAVKELLNASSEDRESILKQFTIGGELSYPYGGENINNIDLIQYTEYLRNYKPPEGVDLSYEQDPEQLIKMKLPKKLQKDILSKSIRLTKKIDEQTQRLFT